MISDSRFHDEVAFRTFVLIFEATIAHSFVSKNVVEGLDDNPEIQLGRLGMFDE